MANRTYKWNWTTVTGTKNDGKRVRKSAASLTSRALPARGSWDVNKLASIHGETLNDVMKLFSQWNTVLQPVMKSLSAGGSDQRWSGLRKEIDAVSYGLDGTTLFVFQDASPSNFDGRYWDDVDKRPYTISEVLEDHDGRLAALEADTTSSASTSLFDDTDLWTAVGYGKKPGSTVTSASNSLHGTQLTIQNNLEKLAKDVYGVSDNDPSWPSYSTTWSGPVFKFGIYEYLAYITDLHGVDMTASEDPWNVSHASLGSHTHPQSEIESSGYSTLGRTFGLPADLEEDLQRIRYEIEYTRGTAWNTGTINGPFVTNYPSSGNSGQTLYSHINYTGSGTASANNPHAMDFTDTGADVIFGNVATFTGQASITDIDPSYTSTLYVTQGVSLTTGISELDAALGTVAGGVVYRTDYYEDRTIYSEAWRETHPIEIAHSFNKKPHVQVVDLTPSSEDIYGQYQSLDQYSNTVHVDDNNIEVWTNAASVQIILIG